MTGIFAKGLALNKREIEKLIGMIKVVGLLLFTLYLCYDKTNIAKADYFENFKYDVLHDGTVIVLDYNGSSKQVEIPEYIEGKPVTRVSRCLFSGHWTSVKIPASVKTIDIYGGCITVEYIEVDEKNPVFDSRNNCNAVIRTDTNELILGCKNTKIPNGVERIDEYAFWCCKGLESVTFPNSVKTIEHAAFLQCYELKEIRFSNSIEYIYPDAFEERGLYRKRFTTSNNHKFREQSDSNDR